MWEMLQPTSGKRQGEEKEGTGEFTWITLQKTFKTRKVWHSTSRSKDLSSSLKPIWQLKNLHLAFIQRTLTGSAFISCFNFTPHQVLPILPHMKLVAARNHCYGLGLNWQECDYLISFVLFGQVVFRSGINYHETTVLREGTCRDWRVSAQDHWKGEWENEKRRGTEEIRMLYVPRE